MAVMILLSREWRNRLFSHAPKGSKAADALSAAVDITPYVRSPQMELSVACDEDLAEIIRQLAIAHCPEAASEIGAAIDIHRRTSS
jgi:hypothetical protein